ncbi:MAG: hypothetical protein HYR75_09785, partial [Gemmatimonadetes bacterium]|nr:hypothetical protein [Gemmatimonadota bacterium]
MHRPFLLGASALAFALSAAGAQRPARAPRHGADSLTFTPQLGAPALPADGGRPAISAVGELVADLSPDGSTQPDSARFGVRTVELGLQSTLERRLRATIFVSANDRQRVTIDEATLGTDALPWGVRLRLGRALMPVGKENTEHRHDLHTVEYPYVVQRFLQADGLRGTGIAASKAFAPFGFQQELTVSWVDRFGDAIDSLTTREPASRYVDGMGYAARLRNYWTLARDADFELSGSAVTGRRPTSTG